QRYAGKKELIDIDPPDAVCRGVLARNEEERDLNSLRGICTAPTLRLDGSVVDQPGYDSATGLLLSLPSESHPVIPNAPNVELAKDALAYIWKPFKDFPFIDDLARSVFIAALLTAPIRKNLPTAPGNKKSYARPARKHLVQLLALGR
ncbi:hypothetical protein CKO12_13655, partial [Chromatium okenii]|nr:hypothetical protein [Chromatium okenii]